MPHEVCVHRLARVVAVVAPRVLVSDRCRPNLGLADLREDGQGIRPRDGASSARLRRRGSVRAGGPLRGRGRGRRSRRSRRGRARGRGGVRRASLRVRQCAARPLGALADDLRGRRRPRLHRRVVHGLRGSGGAAPARGRHRRRRQRPGGRLAAGQAPRHRRHGLRAEPGARRRGAHGLGGVGRHGGRGRIRPRFQDLQGLPQLRGPPR
mmetsp:Transcript_40010/g.120965  ORF Transcript_40010/g.120965 Transcript_40010/m.120965 type:complete len:209 (+) Transcript_40010:803-1429(+)